MGKIKKNKQSTCLLWFLVYWISIAPEHFACHWSDKVKWSININTNNINFAYQVSVLELLFPPTVCHYSCLLKLNCHYPMALILEIKLWACNFHILTLIVWKCLPHCEIKRQKKVINDIFILKLNVYFLN